jgi:hypothetical protein
MIFCLLNSVHHPVRLLYCLQVPTFHEIEIIHLHGDPLPSSKLNCIL